jgi:hypothetical protein
MQGFENDKFIFYTAGKIGTRTLMYTDGMIDITSPWDMHKESSLRKKTLNVVLDRKEITSKKIVVLIREPVSRFHSGMFELTGKIFGAPYIRQILLQGGDISFLNDPSFWSENIEQCLRFSSRTWSPHKEFESHRWQYHIGNWLHDAEIVSETCTDSIILNIKDLSSFLNSHGIPDSHANKYSNIVPGEYEYDTKPVFNAFIQGLNLLTDRVLQVNNYLAPEKECYERLINSQQYYKVE